MKIIQVRSIEIEYEDAQYRIESSCLETKSNFLLAKEYIDRKNKIAKEIEEKYKQDESCISEYMHRQVYSMVQVEINDTFKLDTVQVVFFKDGGKYYTEESVYMPYSEEGHPIDYFKKCLLNHLGERCKGMIAVCMHPNHKLEYPLMVRVNNEGSHYEDLRKVE